MKNHKCKKLASMKMVGDKREIWLGKLTEPISGHEVVTHCLHIKTPYKNISLGIGVGDMIQMAVFSQIAHGGPIEQRYLCNLENILREK